MKQKLAILLGILIFPSLIQANETEAKAILQKAIRAMGGMRALNQWKTPVMWMERGKFYHMGETIPFICQFSSKWPNWVRQEFENAFTTTFNGNKVWITSKAGVKKFTGQQLKDNLKMVRATWAIRLFPLKTPDYKLSTIDEIKVNGRPSVGIQVKHKQGDEFKLYFDSKTTLLTKTELTVSSSLDGNKPILQEVIYSDHKYSSGMNMPTKYKVYSNKKLFMESKVVDYKIRATLDPKLFEVPK